MANEQMRREKADKILRRGLKAEEEFTDAMCEILEDGKANLTPAQRQTVGIWIKATVKIDKELFEMTQDNERRLRRLINNGRT